MISRIDIHDLAYRHLQVSLDNGLVARATLIGSWSSSELLDPEAARGRPVSNWYMDMVRYTHMRMWIPARPVSNWRPRICSLLSWDHDLVVFDRDI